MKENIGKRVKLLTLGVLSFLSVGVYTSCIDDIPEGNRFTFTGELIADHLENDTAYSNFCWILEKATTGRNGRGSSMLTTLSTYGAYTCFAPTNEAINSFLVEKYNVVDVRAVGDKLLFLERCSNESLGAVDV